jgi:hypothetical protein
MAGFEVVNGGGIVKKDIGIQNKILHTGAYDIPARRKKPIFQTLEKN